MTTQFQAKMRIHASKQYNPSLKKNGRIFLLERPPLRYYCNSDTDLSDNEQRQEYYKKIQWCIQIKMRMPRDLSQYPDFPEKLENMSYEEHYKAILNFWEIHDAISGED